LVQEKSGSTLTWVMIVSIVLTLMIVTMLSVISYNSHTTNLARTQTQAYYTAQTVNDRIVNWLTGTPTERPLPTASNYDEVIKQFEFIEMLKAAGSWSEPYDAVELGGNMGTATVELVYTVEQYVDTITITTTAIYDGVSQTLVSEMNTRRMSSFYSVNPGFDYSDPGIVEDMIEVAAIPTWATNASLAEQYSHDTGWWSFYQIDTGPTATTVDYTMDLLSVAPGDFVGYPANTTTPTHSYSYKYLENSNAAGRDLVHINLNPSRGSYFLSQTTATVITDNPVMIGDADNERLSPTDDYFFPYSLNDRNGVLLSIADAAAYNYQVPYQKIVYYTLDHTGLVTRDQEGAIVSDYWPDMTLGTAFANGITPPATPLTFQNLSIYLTDNSESIFEINSGLVIGSGTMFTKRNTLIGTIFNEPGNSLGLNHTVQNDLVFDNYTLIFANPGLVENPHQSLIVGASALGWGGTARTILLNGSILVQKNHQLTIGGGTVINAQQNKGIVVEPGGILVLEDNANITGNIYIASGAELIINGQVTITGNIFCSGTLTINSRFTLNALNSQANMEMGYWQFSERGNTAGIFIYNDVTMGVGTLIINDTNPTSITISGTANRIHSFRQYPALRGDFFCNHAIALDHMCLAWSEETRVWVAVPGSTREGVE